MDLDKYEQRHSIQNILPEWAYLLKKHEVNGNRRLELFKQYEEQKKGASQLAEYWEAVCFHSVLDLTVKILDRKT